ncbi:cytochrome P450 [Oligoflexaceae bacterium]|nr:cytochrome P450 [Oligoflexaceae bacterium]
MGIESDVAGKFSELNIENVEIQVRSPQFQTLKNNFLEFLLSFADSDQDLIVLNIKDVQTVIVVNPKIAYYILSKPLKSIFLKSGILNSLGGLFGDGLLTSNGDTHQRHKDQIAKYFFSQSNERRDLNIEKVSQKYVREIAEQVSFDPQRIFSNMSLEMLGHFLFNADLSEHLKPISDSLAVLYLLFEKGSGFADPEDGRSKAARENLEKILAKIQKDHGGKENFLSAFSCESNQVLTDQFLTFLVAGHETTGIAISWAFALISKYGASDSFYEEAMNYRRAKKKSKFETSETDAIILETLRLFPPVWNMNRRCSVDISTPTSQINSGSQFFISPYLLHKSKSKFENPDKYRPERWKSDTLKKADIMPFGAGFRSCIGEQLAMKEMRIFLLEFFAENRLESNADLDLTPTAHLTLKPHKDLLLKRLPR